MVKNYFADIMGINLEYALEAYDWQGFYPMTDNGITVTPSAESHGFSPDLLWLGLRSGCRNTKSRNLRSESAKLSGALDLPVWLHWLLE